MIESKIEKTLVMKFGGTSVGSTEAMSQVVKIVTTERPRWENLVVVASAFNGITDLLLKSATQAAQGNTLSLQTAANTFVERHYTVLNALVTNPALNEPVKQEINQLVFQFINLCQAIAILGEATPRALDAVVSLGERMSIRVIAASLEAGGVTALAVDATDVIVTDNAFQNAHPDMEATSVKARRVLHPILKAGKVPVVTGFIAATPGGSTTTLGRGGSDYSAGIVGAALPATEVWIWSDVDGILTTDPRIVPEARPIPELSYREISELAFYGAKVLHPMTIRPVIEAGIGLRLCNTFNPDHPGTRLVKNEGKNHHGIIKAVTAVQKISMITVEGRGMLGVPGVAARIFGTVAATGTSVPLITQASSEQSVCFAVPADAAQTVAKALEKTFAQELADRDIDRIWASSEATIITVVGAGMIHTPGVAGRVFSALGANNVNIIAIAQGSSEVSISLVTDAADTRKALTVLNALIEQ